MRPLAAMLYLVSFAWVSPATTQTTIQRCVDAHGGTLFTDQPCADVQATATRPTANLSDDAANTSTPQTKCATNVTELRQGVIQSFAQHDANRLSGLMLWEGYGAHAATAHIRMLSALVQQPLLDARPNTQVASASSTSGTPAVTSAADTVMLFHVHAVGDFSDETPQELRYNIARRSGCLWLQSEN